MNKIVATSTEVQQQFLAAMRAAGLELSPHQSLQFDGTFHRCDVSKKPGSSGRGDGTYVLHLVGPIPFGGFWNWTDNKKWQPWHFEPGRKLTAAERQELERKAAESREQYEHFRKKLRAEARKKAKSMWAKAPTASARHAYCEAKQIEPYGARMWRFKDSTPLLIPFYDEKGRRVNLSAPLNAALCCKATIAALRRSCGVSCIQGRSERLCRPRPQSPHHQLSRLGLSIHCLASRSRNVRPVPRR
jgi:phage/plasmid primase-like uncharacterized protein